MIETIYVPEEIKNRFLLGPSVFLAGPTPRDNETLSWRPAAIDAFRRLGFQGTLLLPECRSGIFQHSYDDQIEWEEKGLNEALCIMFWVPRELEKMPAFTTNDEWGSWKASGKVVWGNPPEAQKVSYQRYYAKKLGVPLHDDLDNTVSSAILLANEKWQQMHKIEVF